MVESARLEYECAGYTAPRVRIPPSPPCGKTTSLSTSAQEILKADYLNLLKNNYMMA